MEDVDWKEGEKIVIASTDLGIEDNEIAGEGDNSEVRTITSVLGRQFFLDAPLEYEHYANTDEYGFDADGNLNTNELRAEVGLLSRNIIFQGDPETSAENQYGATIMLHSPQDESSIGRISYCEFKNVG
jgi:cell migration-inducing and hyaluronan-binding protein